MKQSRIVKRSRQKEIEMMLPTRSRVMREIQKEPGIAIHQICRKVNEKWLPYCVKKSCYANPRKRTKWGKRKSDCDIHSSSIKYHVNKLERNGIIKTKRMKKPDSRQNRGWDWMRSCFPPGKMPKTLPIKDIRKLL